jgi:hypothetical protein
MHIRLMNIALIQAPCPFMGFFSFTFCVSSSERRVDALTFTESGDFESPCLFGMVV